MKNKLVFHADKMKLVCILFSISIIVNICAWCAFIIASDYSIIDDSYLSNLNYLNLIFIAFPASIVELIPLVLCVLMLIYNKIKHNAKVLLKVCDYVMAALNLWILVQRLLNQNDDTNKLTTSGYFLFVLPQIISIVGFIAMGISDKCFDISRIGVVFAAILRAVASAIPAVSTLINANKADGQLYQLNKFIGYYYIGRCIYSIIFAVALAVLLFCVFTREKSSVEDRIADLNQDYTSGKITKDSYDAQREELLKEI